MWNKLDYCVQGQCHSEGSKFHWTYVRVIPSEPQNILLPNLAWWCSTMSRSVMWVKIVCYLQGQGHSEGSYAQNRTFYYIFWTAHSLATIHGLMIHHHKVIVSCEKKKKVFLRSRSRWHVNKYLSSSYLLDRQAFCYQPSQREAGLLSDVFSCLES